MQLQSATGHRGDERALRHLRGQGRFTSDLPATGALHAVFVRSPHAHAAVEGIDISVARAVPGVVAVLTGADIAAAGFRPMPTVRALRSSDGAPIVVPRWPMLADDFVRYVGQPVAAVIGESVFAAMDGAEAVEVAYRPFDTPEAAAAAADGAPDVALDWAAGDGDAVVRAARSAACTVRIETESQRVAAAPMETRAALALPRAGGFDLHVGSQGAAFMRVQLLDILGWPEERLRVVTPDVGGAFGAKTAPYPEYAALLLAAETTGRPVRWVATRSEAFLADNQGRGTRMTGELMLDADGRILALRAESVADLGAYLTTHGALTATQNFAACLSGCYAIPEIHVRVVCRLSTTAPVGPYRGAGRPEANYLLERLMDAAARETGLDPVEIRRRNLIAPASLPRQTPLGAHYDSGAFADCLDRCLALADRDGLAARRKAAAARGRLLGFGLGMYLEMSGGLPDEVAAVELDAAGRLRVLAPGQSSGQPQARTLGRVAAQALGLPEEAVEIVQGDSRLLPLAGPSVASRTMAAGGSAVHEAALGLIETGRPVAAEMLQARPEQLRFADGTYTAAGGRQVALQAVAARAAETGHPLAARASIKAKPTFPNGCHVAEVEIDPETGEVSLARYVAVDDVGRVIDHAAVEGQLHGGVAQGAGQVLMEQVVYDADTAQLLNSSYMDYAVPRASDMPRIVAECVETVPCATNPLGVKGAGEGGTTGALGTIAGAINDALASVGAGPVEMPATSERVWRAIRAATMPAQEAADSRSAE